MANDVWGAVDRYIAEMLVGQDRALDAALAASDTAGMPAINVSPNHGKLLHLLASMQGARRVLEIGTLAGYSTIWLARALAPGGRVVSFEIEPRHAEVARANIARAGLAEVVEVRVGAALAGVRALLREGAEPFDFVFIDADKRSNPEYFAAALALSRRGGLIVVDNVVRGGAVLDSGSDDADVQGVRRLYEIVAGERRVSATAVQTVGCKGYDGLLIALVTGEP